MTTTTNRSQSKTHDRSAATRRGTRPNSQSMGATGSETSADEIRETVKEAVGKGVAAVAGAVEGIDETMQETQLGDTAESAIRQVGETATKVVKAAKEETHNLKEAFTGEGDEGASSQDDDAQIERDDPTFSHGSGVGNPGSGSFSSGSIGTLGDLPRGPYQGSSQIGGSSYNTEAASDGTQLSSELEDSGTYRPPRAFGADDDEEEDLAL